MGQLDASIVTLTYGSLRTEFHTSLAAVEWVSLAYLLTLVALLIPAGWLADAHGRKLLYLYGFAVFTLASAACGLAPSLEALVGFRVVQAAGAALMQSNSVALVTTSAPRERMRAALGGQAAAQALGLALGPTVGGALVSTLGWRWVFGVNVPIGLVALVAGHYLLPRTRARTRAAGFDWQGLALLAVATTSALLGVSAVSGLPVPG
jgi:MFS family permease